MFWKKEKLNLLDERIEEEFVRLRTSLVAQEATIRSLSKELAVCQMKISTLEGLSGFSIYPDNIPDCLLTTYVERYPKTSIKEVVTGILDHLNLYMKREPAKAAVVILEKKKAK